MIKDDAFDQLESYVRNNKINGDTGVYDKGYLGIFVQVSHYDFDALIDENTKTK